MAEDLYIKTVDLREMILTTKTALSMIKDNKQHITQVDIVAYSKLIPYTQRGSIILIPAQGWIEFCERNNIELKND